MQHDFATTAAQTVIPQVGAAKRYDMKNWNDSKKKELPREKSRLLRTTTKNEDQTMDQNNGLEAKTSRGEIRITRIKDLQKIFPHLRIFPQGQTSQMGTTIRAMEDHMINAQISQSKTTMETDLGTNISTDKMEIGETMEIFPVLRRLQGENSHKINHTANQEVINPTSLPSSDLTIDLRPGLHPMNKNFAQNNNQTSSNVVRFTRTDDTIIELSDLCPLNY